MNRVRALFSMPIQIKKYIFTSTSAHTHTFVCVWRRRWRPTNAPPGNEQLKRKRKWKCTAWIVKIIAAPSQRAKVSGRKPVREEQESRERAFSMKNKRKLCKVHTKCTNLNSMTGAHGYIQFTRSTQSEYISKAYTHTHAHIHHP